MEEKKEVYKSAEQRASEATFQRLLTFMSAKTFSRHALLSEEDFLKEIGFEKMGMKEDEAVRLGIANLSASISNRVLQIKNALKTMRQIVTIKSGKSEEELLKAIQNKKEKKNGNK